MSLVEKEVKSVKGEGKPDTKTDKGEEVAHTTADKEEEEPETKTDEEKEEAETKTDKEKEPEKKTDEEMEEPETKGDKDKEELKIKIENEEPEQQHAEFTVFVGKLSAKVTAERLKEHFNAAGEIVAVSMPFQVLMKAKRCGFAFIIFADKEAYKAALKMHQSKMYGQRILVLPVSKSHLGFMAMEVDEEKQVKPKERKANEKKPEKPKEAPFAPLYKNSKHIALIKNLPPGTSEDDILKFFGVTRENIVAITIAYPPKAKQKVKKPLRGIIAFKTTEDLEKALGMTNKQLNGQEGVVERHMTVVRPEKRSAEEGQDGDVTASKRQMTVVQPEKRSGEEGQDGDVTPNKQAKTAEGSENNSGTDGMELDLFVKQIPKRVTEKHLKDFFGSPGAIVKRVTIFEDAATRTSRGMGFVTMADKESVQKGLLMNNKWIFSKKVVVMIRHDREHLEKPVRPDTCYSTFICDLPVGVEPDIVRTAVHKYLKKNYIMVKSVHVPASANGPGNQGFAFVDLEDEASLTRIYRLSNSEVDISDKKYSIIVSDCWPEPPPPREDEPPPVSKVALATLAGRRQERLFPKNRGPRGSRQMPPVRGSDSRRSEGNFGRDDLQSRRDRDKYLEYLEYRECMMIRSALAEKEELIRRMREREALHQLAVVPSGLDALASLLLGHSALLKKEEPLRSAFPTLGRGERSGFDSTLSSAGDGPWRDFTDLRELLVSRSKEAVRERIPTSGLGSLVSSGDRDISALLQRPLDPIGREDSGQHSDTFASLHSSRSQMANESSLTRNRLPDSSVVSLDRDSLTIPEFQSSIRGSRIDQRRTAELEAKFGSTADKYEPVKDKCVSIVEKFGPVNDKYVSTRDKYGPVDDKYVSVKDKYEPIKDKYEPVEDKYGRVEGKYVSIKDKYGPVEDKYGSSEDKYVCIKDKYEPVKDKYESVRDKYRPVEDKYVSVMDKYGPIEDKYVSIKDKYGPVDDKYVSVKDKFGPVKDKYGPIEDKYVSVKDKYGPVKGKYESIRDKYGSVEDKYGSTEDNFRFVRSSPEPRAYLDLRSADYTPHAVGSSSSQGDCRFGGSSVDKPNLVNTLTSPAGLGVLQNFQNRMWMGNLNKSM